ILQLRFLIAISVIGVIFVAWGKTRTLRVTHPLKRVTINAVKISFFMSWSIKNKASVRELS
ncbi:hypothetical protein OFC62_24850, partial [Escherichia coli]|nr:hypothetical protein [Escherichia coli]